MSQPRLSTPRLAALMSCLAAAALAACGGGSGGDADAAQAGAESVAGLQAQPVFHMAPAQLAEPADVDADGSNASAGIEPHRFQVDSSMDSTRLTPDGLAALQRAHVQSATARPAATTITAAVYTPAQIRAAYGLAAVPASVSGLSAANAAALGAGQTIYLVDAYDHPNALSDLNKFSAKFGLPACTNVALTASSALPLSKASSTACTFSVAYASSAGALQNTAPAYNADWIPEIALDVQWAHAIAPLARIVLVEAADASSTSLLGGIALANKMGAGVVSMSFGVAEGSWVPSLDASFSTTGMTYVAAAGDNGAQVMWPAVSPKVLAVGGTSLQWSGSGTRYEAGWSGSGGGVSAVEPLPAWQSGTVVPGAGAAKMRTVTDVSFNADPNTGQYVALTAKDSSTTSWNAYGGTSIASPQWAGLVAVANARRVAASKALLGDFHTAIYKTIAGSAATYAADFGDVVNGSDGNCATCVAAAGYDTVTGWGTPNATALLNTLATDSTVAAAVAPTVPGGAFSTQTGSAFSQSLGITAPAGVTTTYALSGAPGGLSVNASGVLSWAAPVAGSYAFTATATTSAGASASGKYTLTVVAVNHPPVVASGTITVKAGTAFSVAIPAGDPDGDAITFKMTGAPSGLALGSAGVLSWSKAVKGVYTLKITVTDSHGLAGAVGTITLTVTS